MAYKLSSLALWAISGLVSFFGCLVFYRNSYFQQWTNQMFSYTIFAFTALLFAEFTRSIGKYLQKLPIRARAVRGGQKAPVEGEGEEDGLLLGVRTNSLR